GAGRALWLPRAVASRQPPRASPDVLRFDRRCRPGGSGWHVGRALRKAPDELQDRLRARLPPVGGGRKTTLVQREVYATARARGARARAGVRTRTRYRDRQRDLGQQPCGAGW